MTAQLHELSSAPIDILEFEGLRHELLLRIAIQNGAMLVMAPLFLVSIMVMLAQPTQAGFMALAYVIADCMAALMWLHIAARTTQIKYYLTLVLEPRLRQGGGWERWHARNRIAGPLGSYWRLSTLGVFVGSAIAALAAGWRLGPIAAGTPIWIGGVIAAVMVALIRAPRMAPELRAAVADAHKG